VVSAGGAAFNQGTAAFPDAAIATTGSVLLHPGHTQSTPPEADAASVLANGNIGNAGSVVDGDAVAGGTVSLSPAQVSGDIRQNAGAVIVPPAPAQIEAWRAGLRAQAQSGGTLTGSIRWKDTTVTAPVYIQGSLVVEGTVTITGSGPVYATSSIKLQGGPQVTSQGAFLVSDTLVEFSGGTDYRVTNPVAAGVISFGSSASALKLTGGSAGHVQGLAYAPYGGILLSGTSAWHGALLAHGSGTLGKIDLSGGSQVEYPVGLMLTSSLLSGLRVDPIAGTCG